MHTLSLSSLLFAFLPAVAVVAYMAYRAIGYQTALYAFARMGLQLSLIGYVLIYIFEAKQSWIVLGVLSVMMLAAGWIALRTVPTLRTQLYTRALLSIVLGGGVTLALVTQAAIGLEPWFQPSYMIPLAGMIFANSMNAISLSSERLYKGLRSGSSYDEAFGEAFNASLIPNINALFAVGLVSLPGMMTGQILSGVSPLIAARYQMMVMGMIFGASGLSVILFLRLSRAQFLKTAP